MLRVLGTIAQAATKAGIDPATVMGQFSKAPEVALMGLMVAEGANEGVLKDAAASYKLRKVQGDKFISMVDKAQTKPDVSDLMPVLKATPGMADPVVHMANAVYEYRHRRDGLTSFSPDLYRQGVREILGERKVGGVAYGGPAKQGAGWFDGKTQADVIVPPSVRQDSFDDLVGAIKKEDLLLTGQPLSRDGQPISVERIRKAEWVSVGGNKYGLRFGEGEGGVPLMAMDQNGKPFVFNLNPILDKLKTRKPEIFIDYRAPEDGLTAPPSPPQRPVVQPPGAKPADEPGGLPQPSIVPRVSQPAVPVKPPSDGLPMPATVP
jgi:hypothetical protein